MSQKRLARRLQQAWRTFRNRDGQRIEREVRLGFAPHCPYCEELLEAQPVSRLSPCLVLDARAYDLTCRDCRRFWCLVRHTPRSLRLIRMRRFAAAVNAVELRPAASSPAPLRTPTWRPA